MPFPDLFDRFALSVLPNGVSEVTRQKFKAIARYSSARTGDAPFKGNGQDQIVFLASGSTKLVAHASQGREQVVAFHFAGDLISVPASGAHAYSLSALDDCELIYFPAADFLQLAQQEEKMVNQMLDRALSALARCREKTVTLGRKTAQERLASFLVTMAGRVGQQAKHGVEMDLPMSRRDIGDSLGLTIETVSRQLSELRAAGLLSTPTRSLVCIADIDGLKARAGHIQTAA